MRLVAFALCGVLLCTCGPVTRTSTAATLTFTGLGGEPDSLNPLVSSLADVYALSHLYLSYLLETDDRGRLVPEIADRVPTRENGGISADGKRIVYHLRHGVRWQDGVPLRARDVAFSFSAVMNPANAVPTRLGLTEIASVETPRDDTVVVHLRRPFSPILAYFFGSQSIAGLLPEHLLGRYRDLNHVPYNALPVGSGPYRVVEWKRGESVTFVANPSYWRGKPRIGRLVYRIVADPNARLLQLESGAADAYFDVDPQILPQLRSIRGIRIDLTPVNDLHVIRFNLHDPVVGDVRVRRAIALSIDRTQLIAAATHGSGLIVDGDQPRNGWAYDRNLAELPYDPAAAKTLLDAAGWRARAGGVREKMGVPLELTLAIAPQIVNGSALVATVIQQELRGAGIGVTIKQVPSVLLWAPAAAGGILASGRYQLAYDAWWVLGPDPDDTWNFGCAQLPPSGENFYFWCNRRADAAMYAALTTYSRPARVRDYAIVQREIGRDLPEFTLWQVRMPNAYRPRLRGVSPSPFGSLFWNAWSWTLDG